MTSEYTIDNALHALPHLVHCAQVEKTITYGELAAKIGRHHRAAQHFLCYIRDELCRPRGLPLLTAIVVSKTTGLPGPGWLPEGAYRLSAEEYRRRFEAYRDQVFKCDRWDGLLQELGLLPVQGTDDELDEEGRSHATYLERTGQVEEGDAHRLLKQYVARTPAAVGLQVVERADQEYLFVSGDRCDVVFDLGEHGQAVIEVKGSERGELVKGIYQAVKYRALMAAEKGHGSPYPVAAYIVAYDHIPRDIQTLATRLDIHCYVVPHTTVCASA